MTDAQQFEAFMSKYQDMVFSTALRLTSNVSEAQDISQEVFLRAYAHFEELKDSSTAGGWLRTVARNLSLNHLARYRSRWSFFSELVRKEEAESEPFDLPAPDDVEQELEDQERHATVERALQSLPTAQRVPLVLYHIEGMKYEEIAEQLQVSLAKVKTDIFRGRERLRKRLRLVLSDEIARSN